MNWKSLLVLVVIAAAAVWGVMQINQPTEQVADTTIGQALYPKLAESVNDVSEVTLTTAGTEPAVSLKRQQDGWTVANLADYPADVSKVRALLLQLVDSKIVEEKTANPEFFDRLGVADKDQAEGGGVLV